jgi:hypothetical protein
MSTPSTLIIALANALPDLSRRVDHLIKNNEDTPGKETTSFNRAIGEMDSTKRHILEQRPRNLADAAIQLMLAYDVAADCRACCLAEVDVREAAEHSERLLTVLARALRVVADAAGVDLTDFAGADFLEDEPDIFPECAASA